MEKNRMKKTLILLIVMIAALTAATTPGVVHIVFDNGVVTTSGDDTFYEFDIQAYVTGTSSADDLKFGYGNIYVEYDNELFGSYSAGTSNIEYTQTGLLASTIYGMFPAYEITNGVAHTFENVFCITFEAAFSNPDYYTELVSSDPENPSDLLHIKMKAIAAGSGEVSFPVSRINNVDGLFWTVGEPGLQYVGPHDFSAAVEPVYIEGPVTGEPYTSIELDYFSADNKGSKVRLRWRTQSETENLGFIVKRALVLDEGVYGLYEVIDSYVDNDELVGAGTTTKKTDYLYWDNEVKPGVSYAYVLQDVDEGGHIRECEPVIVTVKETKVISNDKFEFTSSYPNPFNPSFVVPFELYA